MRHKEFQKKLTIVEDSVIILKTMINQCVDVIRMSREARVDAVKGKIIELYCRYVKRLNKGYKDDYTNLLNMINYLSLPYDFQNDQKIYEYLINVRP